MMSEIKAGWTVKVSLEVTDADGKVVSQASDVNYGFDRTTANDFELQLTGVILGFLADLNEQLKDPSRLKPPGKPGRPG